MEQIKGIVVANATVNDVKETTVVNFRIAENRKYKDRQGNLQEATRFFDCAWWGVDSVAKHLTKGKLVFIEGFINARAYIKKDTDEAVAQLTLKVTRLQMFDIVKKGAATDGADKEFVAPDDDRPF
ncbi:MAG: single-stranded DNA-binding protein [Puia sp.]|nr:single-stranded DNA-binding protein [Puia sp.]